MESRSDTADLDECVIMDEDSSNTSGPSVSDAVATTSGQQSHLLYSDSVLSAPATGVTEEPDMFADSASGFGWLGDQVCSQALDAFEATQKECAFGEGCLQFI